MEIDSSKRHNGSKVELKFGKYRLFKKPHPRYSPDISPCDFWLFGILKGILKDRESTSSGEIEGAITNVWNGLPFNDVQSGFRN
jgi:hypothetical protein